MNRAIKEFKNRNEGLDFAVWTRSAVENAYEYAGLTCILAGIRLDPREPGKTLRSRLSRSSGETAPEIVVIRSLTWNKLFRLAEGRCGEVSAAQTDKEVQDAVRGRAHAAPKRRKMRQGKYVR